MEKTQSQKLRENKNQHSLKNIESKEMDVKIINIVKEIQPTLSQKYGIKVYFQKTLPNRYVESLVNKENFTLEGTNLNPDGGFLYILINGKKYFILVPEQKRQGTNDKRLLEGLKIQSKGNAIERLGKNVKGCDSLFGDEDIYPFVAFIQGCDFYETESTIVDRVRTIACYQELNKINLFWKQLQKHQFFGGSYFMRGHSMHDAPGSSDWTYDEMYGIMYEIADRSIEHYLEKYNK